MICVYYTVSAVFVHNETHIIIQYESLNKNDHLESVLEDWRS